MLGAILEAIFMDGGGGDERGRCNSNRKKKENKKKKKVFKPSALVTPERFLQLGQTENSNCRYHRLSWLPLSLQTEL